MKWHFLQSTEQLAEIDKKSQKKKILLFKHSTRCHVSLIARQQLENKWIEEDNKFLLPYFIDLIQYRNVSNAIADHYGIRHESPQVLIIDKGKCIYDVSHSNINYVEIISKSSLSE